MKLKKLGKIIVTLIVMIISCVVYAKTGVLGELAQDNNTYAVFTILAWVWLVFGQLAIYCVLWEE